MFGLTPYNRNAVRRNGSNGVVDFYNMFDDFFNDDLMPFRRLRDDTFKIDIKENGGAYSIEAEMPGIGKEEISIDYSNDQLVIAVHKKEEVNEDKDNYIHRERRVSSMQRSIYLKDADVAGIEAKLENGILHIEVPKKQESAPKHVIEIK